MHTCKPQKQILWMGFCAFGVAFLAAAVLGEQGAQPKPVIKPKVEVYKHTIEAAHLEPATLRKPIPFKKLELKEFKAQKGKKLTPDALITLPNKKTIKVADYLKFLNDAEAKLNTHGLTVRKKLPKGGVEMLMKGRADQKLIVKQREQIASLLHKATPAQEKEFKDHLARHTKEQVPALLRDAQAEKARIEAWRRSKIDEVGKLDAKDLSPAELKLQQHFLKLSQRKPPAELAMDQIKFTIAQPKLQAEVKETHDLMQNIKFTNEGARKNFAVLTKSWEKHYDDSWNWSLGKKSTAEAYVNTSLKVSAYESIIFGSALHTRGAVQAGGYVLDKKFTLFDALAELNSTQTSTHLHLHARFMGHDIFKPIDETKASNSKYFYKDYPWDKIIIDGPVMIGCVPVHYEVGIRGAVEVEIGASLTPTFVSMVPVVNVRTDVYAAAAVDLLIARAGVRGTLNLIDNKLTIGSAAVLKLAGSNPNLEIQYSVHDKLSLLGGHVDLYAEIWVPDFPDIWNGDYETVGTLRLFSWKGITPVNGYLVDPHTITLALK